MRRPRAGGRVWAFQAGTVMVLKSPSVRCYNLISKLSVMWSVHSYDVGTRKSRRTLLAAERTSLPAYPVSSQA